MCLALASEYQSCCGWEILVNDWEFMEEFSFNCIMRIPGIDYYEKNKNYRAEAEAEAGGGMDYGGRIFCKQASREGNCSYICS